MNQSTQQTSFLSDVVEQPPEWVQLAVPAEQTFLLHEGDAQYIPQFITAAEEADLLVMVDKSTWQNDLRRRVQHYGYRYDYKDRNINTEHDLGVLPFWAEQICTQLIQKNIFNSKPDQLIVNEYQPGQGIAPHTDRNCFGPVVASLSLGCDCMMRITPNGEERDAFDVVLQRGSLLVLQGRSRDEWRHSIAPRKSDTQHGRKIPRQRRVSLTFRTVETNSAPQR